MRGVVRGEGGMGLVAVIGLDRMCDLMQETDAVMRGGGGVNQTGTESHRSTL
jgi:hypothetical protein